MKISSMVEFKSIEENYRKEQSGLKQNTVRVVSKAENRYLQFILEDIKYIKINLAQSEKHHEHFVRLLTDITSFEVRWADNNCGFIYIFSW